MSVRFLFAICMMVDSGNASYLVHELWSPNKDDGLHFDIPPGTTRITLDSWAGWDVEPHLVTSITIPDSVTAIGEGAFAHCSSLAAVTIPSSVTVIERQAFANCSSLAAVTIPSSVTVIERRAFAGCLSLAAVTIPSSVTVIERGAFAECSSLAAVTIPSSVTAIGEGAFAYCSSLAAVTIPSSVTKLADDAFSHCAILMSIDYGWVADLAAPNRFPELNRIARTATVEHPLEAGDSCVVRRTWPASTAELTPAVLNYVGNAGTPATYAGTEPGPVTEVVDATGIISPILVMDLGGNEYPVHGCWAADRPTADFKALAAAQHPEALGDPATWSVALPEAEVAVDTLDLAAVAMMLARGELSLDEPWMLVWNKVKDNKDTGGAARK